MWGIWELFLLSLQISISLKLSENLKIYFKKRKYLPTYTINLVITVYDTLEKHFWYNFFKISMVKIFLFIKKNSSNLIIIKVTLYREKTLHIKTKF